MANMITIQNADGSITNRQMTPQEIAALKKQIHNQMNSVINYGYSVAQQGVHIGPTGPTTSQYNPPKQPQDKVLRMVMRRAERKTIVTACVIWSAYMCFFSALCGAVVSTGIWWNIPPTILPPALGIFFVWHWVKKFFKEAEARADLLDWPEQ